MNYFRALIIPKHGLPFVGHFDLNQPLINFSELSPSLEAIEILDVVLVPKPGPGFPLVDWDEDAEPEPCPVHRQPVDRCPGSCEYSKG